MVDRRALVEKAVAGDVIACRAILDRVAPVRKGRPIKLELPQITTAGDVLVALSATIEQMASGEITPDEAAVVLAYPSARPTPNV